MWWIFGRTFLQKRSTYNQGTMVCYNTFTCMLGIRWTQIDRILTVCSGCKYLSARIVLVSIRNRLIRKNCLSQTGVGVVDTVIGIAGATQLGSQHQYRHICKLTLPAIGFTTCICIHIVCKHFVIDSSSSGQAKCCLQKPTSSNFQAI